MQSTIEKWQVTVVVLAIVAAVTTLAALRQANVDVVIAGLFGVAGAYVGAGANAHGVRQGSRATADPPSEA